MAKRVIILVISDMTGRISNENIDLINGREGANYPYGATYQNLYDSRTTERGKLRTKDGVQLWVLPYLEGRVIIDPESDIIKEYSASEFIEFEKTLDHIEIEGEPI